MKAISITALQIFLFMGRTRASAYGRAVHPQALKRDNSLLARGTTEVVP